MQAIYDLRETLCKELEEYGEKGKLDLGGLDIVDKLAHTIKNLDKIIMAYEIGEDGYSSRGSYDDGMSGNYRHNMRNGGSYGRNRRRDSMGRYSRSGDSAMIAELRELMQDAPDDRTRQEFQHFINKMEQM